MLVLDVYECLFSLTIDKKTYTEGDIIELAEYNKLTKQQQKFFYKVKEYQAQKASPKVKEESEFVTESIFEAQFGFKDTLDIPEYTESEGLEEISLPKKIIMVD